MSPEIKAALIVVLILGLPISLMLWISTRPDGYYKPKPKEPNCALDSDPVFGWFLLIGLSFLMALIHWSVGLMFVVFALYTGWKPFHEPRS